MVKKKEESALDSLEEAYMAAKNEIKEKLKDEKCLEQFAEGYKAGYQDGYSDVMKEVMKNMKNMPMTDETGEEIQPGIRTIWWP